MTQEIMIIDWDKKWSAAVYRATRRSRILRPIAMFCATSLLFVMITAAAMTFGLPPEDTTILQRFGGSVGMLGIPMLASWMVSYVIQHLVRRPRPFEVGQGDPLITMTWLGPSFPSAHAAIAMATAVVGAVVAPTVSGPWLFIVAVAVALSRVAVGVHYLFDAIVGLIVGAIVGSMTLTGVLWLVYVSM